MDKFTMQQLKNILLKLEMSSVTTEEEDAALRRTIEFLELL